MSKRLEQVASAQVTLAAGVISFSANDGFRTATRSAVGAYTLSLDDRQAGRKLVVGITANSLAAGAIQGAPASADDTHDINISNFNLSGSATDVSFFITVGKIVHDDGC